MKQATSVEHTGFYAFLAERIRRGTMLPIAVSRANKAFRGLNKDQARKAGRFSQLEVSPRQGDYRVEGVSLARANAFVTQFHRHLNGTVGHLASFGLFDDAGLRGVVILGRPLARALQNGATIEVLRLCSDGSRNACSKLYAQARRFAKANSLSRIITYTLPEESGASLKAAGFRMVGATRGGSWNTASRPRSDKAPTCRKTRWEIQLKNGGRKRATG